MTRFRSSASASEIVLARNSDTSPDVLMALYRKGKTAIHRALASNPSTPERLLLRLGGIYPDHLLANPIWDIWLLAEPDLIRRLPIGTALGLARSKTAPVSLLRELAWSRSVPPPIRANVAANPRCPSDLLEQLRFQAREVRAGVAMNPNALPSWLAILAEDPSGAVRLAAARNPKTPTANLLVLSRDRAVNSVRPAVAGNPKTPREGLRHLANSRSHATLRALLENPSTPRRLQREIRVRLKGLRP